METLWAALEPIFLEALASIIALAVLYATNIIRRKTGIEIQAYDRDSIKTALNNAAALYRDDNLSDAERIERVRDYASGVAADAIGRFNITNEKLTQLAISAIKGDTK